MSRKPTLQGRWTGFYVQYGSRRGIEVEFEQMCQRLEGEMRDLQPETDLSIAEMALDFALPPGEDERIIRQIRNLFPDPQEGAIRFISHLPARSSLLGSVEGDRVRFLKTYLGQHYGGFQIGDRRIGQIIDSHSVQYEGRVDPTWSTVEGRWWIGADPVRQTPRFEGTFVLERASDESRLET